MKKNIGFDLLRVWLSFEVVADHYWIVPTGGAVGAFFQAMKAYAVPCFMMLSFYLTERHYADGDADWLRRRYPRLLVPFLVWPLLYAAVLFLGVRYSPTFVDSCQALTTFTYWKTSLDPRWTDLLWQWTFGSSPRNAMQLWFHVDLMVLTAAVFGLYRLFSARLRPYVLAVMVAAGLTAQYTGFAVWLLGDLPFECKWTLGRIFPTMVFAAVGLSFGMIRGRISSLSSGTRCFLSLSGLWLLLFVFYSKCMTRGLPSLGYFGIHLVFTSIGILAFFHFLPLERLGGFAVRAISLAARYCMGIYCCHYALGWLLYAYVFPHLGVGRETLASNLLIWVASWFLCWLLSLVPGRFTKDLVQ